MLMYNKPNEKIRLILGIVASVLSLNYAVGLGSGVEFGHLLQRVGELGIEGQEDILKPGRPCTFSDGKVLLCGT